MVKGSSCRLRRPRPAIRHASAGCCALCGAAGSPNCIRRGCAGCGRYPRSLGKPVALLNKFDTLLFQCFALRFNHGYLTQEPVAAQIQLALLLHKLAQLIVNDAGVLGKLAKLLLNCLLQLGKLVALRFNLALLLRIQQDVGLGRVLLHCQLALLQLIELLLAHPQPGLVGQQFLFGGHYAGLALAGKFTKSAAALQPTRGSKLPIQAAPSPKLANLISGTICNLILMPAAEVVKLRYCGH